MTQNFVIHADCSNGFGFVLSMPEVFQIVDIFDLPDEVKKVANATHRFNLKTTHPPTEHDVDRLAKLLGGRQYIKVGA